LLQHVPRTDQLLADLADIGGDTGSRGRQQGKDQKNP
jgi:hypothetical protein